MKEKMDNNGFLFAKQREREIKKNIFMTRRRGRERRIISQLGSKLVCSRDVVSRAGPRSSESLPHKLRPELNYNDLTNRL